MDDPSGQGIDLSEGLVQQQDFRLDREGSGETDPLLIDSDGDGCQDGTESGLASPQGAGTDPGVFQPDLDPGTITSALDLDSDNDGIDDGVEDLNCNGRVDPGETDPSGGRTIDLLRNDELVSISPRTPALAGIFLTLAGAGLLLFAAAAERAPRPFVAGALATLLPGIVMMLFTRDTVRRASLPMRARKRGSASAASASTSSRVSPTVKR